MAALPPPPAGVQTIERYGMEFSVVGAPGNAPYPGNVFGTGAGIGGVGTEFGIARLEITNTQWLAFVNAFSPLYTGHRFDSRFTGRDIFPSSLDPNEQPGWYIRPGRENWPADMTWRFAAIYCNWLTNDKGTDPSAFASGAYDTTTFTAAAGGGLNDQLARSAGAKFWIPSLDEWVKATYYDPNKGGTGQGGFWTQPNRSDEPLVSGSPGVGQTNADWAGAFLGGPVGLYANSFTPWGLYDTSGGLAEWTETTLDVDRKSRVAKGTYYYDVVYGLNDNIVYVDVSGGGDSGTAGLRLAGTVPAPPVACIVLTWVGVALSRRRP